MSDASRASELHSLLNQYSYEYHVLDESVGQRCGVRRP